MTPIMMPDASFLKDTCIFLALLHICAGVEDVTCDDAAIMRIRYASGSVVMWQINDNTVVMVVSVWAASYPQWRHEGSKSWGV